MNPVVDWGAGIGTGSDYVRFILLSGLIRTVQPSDIVEIGCGNGTLRQMLPEFPYVGIDLSESDISIARERNPGSTFIGADANDWRPERCGMAVFTESLYYLRDPEAVLFDFSTVSDFLAVSIYHRGWRSPNSKALRMFRHTFSGRTIHDVSIYSGELSWTVAVART